ncbi:hypothetical protein C84B14_00055 [Salinisphaera sp. C84B14]|uniref:hypothetical protein n=1 Tax=Salinisphaera sp. C84B14 TaxID=1304155 RepID=UPI00333FBEE3
MKKELVCSSRGPVTIFSRHVVLNDFADTLLSGLPENFELPQPVAIICGIHNNYRRAVYKNHFTIAIQTEQLLDENGVALWGLRRPRIHKTLLKHLFHADLLLDLSVSNRPAYRWCPGLLKRRLRFGPYIFPSRAPEYVPATSPRGVFIGELSDRRRAMLESLPADTVDIVSGGLYGAALTAAITKHRGIVNVHNEAGVYTEYPRLLLALHAGKPVFSEPLSKELLAGRHYFDLNATPDDDELAEVYTNMAALLTSDYSFADFLRQNVPPA